MKTLKIYNVIATIIILLLVIWLTDLRKDLLETEVLLEQCSELYYNEIRKEETFRPSNDFEDF